MICKILFLEGAVVFLNAYFWKGLFSWHSIPPKYWHLEHFQGVSVWGECYVRKIRFLCIQSLRGKNHTNLNESYLKCHILLGEGVLLFSSYRSYRELRKYLKTFPRTPAFRKNYWFAILLIFWQVAFLFCLGMCFFFPIKLWS